MLLLSKILLAQIALLAHPQTYNCISDTYIDQENKCDTKYEKTSHATVVDVINFATAGRGYMFLQYRR
jgi:hypothetical protein